MALYFGSEWMRGLSFLKQLRRVPPYKGLERLVMVVAGNSPERSERKPAAPGARFPIRLPSSWRAARNPPPRRGSGPTQHVNPAAEPAEAFSLALGLFRTPTRRSRTGKGKQPPAKGRDPPPPSRQDTLGAACSIAARPSGAAGEVDGQGRPDREPVGASRCVPATRSIPPQV